MSSLRIFLKHGKCVTDPCSVSSKRSTFTIFFFFFISKCHLYFLEKIQQVLTDTESILNLYMYWYSSQNFHICIHSRMKTRSGHGLYQKLFVCLVFKLILAPSLFSGLYVKLNITVKILHSRDFFCFILWDHSPNAHT